MPELVCYKLEATELTPNSPLPLLHYKQFFGSDGRDLNAATVYDTFKKNGWDTKWIARYGRTQGAHYHPTTHECMAVLTGPGTIRFGASDTDADPQKNTYGDAWEKGGLEIEARPGDAFVIPAGISHKSFDRAPDAEFKVLTGEDAHSIDGADARQAVQAVQLSGFTMIGACPAGCGWTWSEGGEHVGKYESVWNVPKPKYDPLTGERGGVCTHWK